MALKGMSGMGSYTTFDNNSKKRIFELKTE